MKVPKTLSRTLAIYEAGGRLLQALEACRKEVEAFGRQLSGVDMEFAKGALLKELRRAKPPAGQSLRALVARGHTNFCYETRAGGGDFQPYNLPQTVMKSLIVGEVDELVSGDGWLEATYLKLVRSIEHRLTAVGGAARGLR